MELKNKEHESFEQINEVLRHDWNPIGGDTNRDQYMTYVPAIAAMLWQRATVSELDHRKWDADIMDELKRAEQDLGVDTPFDTARAQRVIAALKGLPRNFSN